MKKIILALTAFSLISGLSVMAQASPQSDLKEFRSYFKKKFPSIKFDDYKDGMYSLPIAADRRAEWEAIMEFPPYELAIAKGKKFWDKNNMSSCFKNGGKGIAHKYPRWDSKKGEVRTLIADLNACLVKKGKKPIKNLKKGKMAQVEAYVRDMARGKRIKPDINFKNKKALAVYEKGKQFYWARRGQLNFSCAHCHISGSGKKVGGNIMGASLGHTAGFPVYRSKWGGLGTLHRRYGGCNKQVRYKPLKAQSAAYTALEVYETYMSTGIPLAAPSQRF